MSGGVYHSPGCRCPGCLPAQYVMRPAPRPRQPARTVPRRQAADDGNTARIWGLIIGAVVGWFFLAWPAYAWHGQNATGGFRWDLRTTVGCCAWWGFLLACVAGWKLTKTERWARWSEAANTAPAAPQAPPVCTHRNKVEVNNGYFEKVGVKKLEAYWCPDCKTQLDPDWKPPAPVTPASGWTWRWWCTCGKSRNGWSATPDGAQAALRRQVASHDRPGHHYEYRWNAAR